MRQAFQRRHGGFTVLMWFIYVRCTAIWLSIKPNRLYICAAFHASCLTSNGTCCFLSKQQSIIKTAPLQHHICVIGKSLVNVKGKKKDLTPSGRRFFLSLGGRAASWKEATAFTHVRNIFMQMCGGSFFSASLKGRSEGSKLISRGSLNPIQAKDVSRVVATQLTAHA